MVRISYKKLRNILEERGITLSELRIKNGLSFGTVSKIAKDEPMNILSLAVIAKYLGVDIGDIVSLDRK